MISQEDFYKIIRTGTYRTPEESKPAKPLKRGFRSWWRYYIRGLLRQIRVGISHVRRKDFKFETFGQLSFGMLKATESTGAVVTFEGFEKLCSLNGGAFVVVGNHISLLETMVLPTVFFGFANITVIAKKSLAKYPGFGTILHAIRSILLERKNARQDLAEVVKQGTALLQDGVSVLLFPQGSRSKVFAARKFNSLGVKLAVKAGVPIVPVACKTDMAICGKGPFKDLGPIDPSRPVKFSLGPILDPSLPQKELQQACTDFISGKLREWGLPVEETETTESTGAN